MPFLQLIRFKNLIIVILTQYLLQYLILVPAFKTAGLVPLLDSFHFGILVLSTLIIAAGGYIINDLEDYEIDLLNKPEKVIINKYITAANARKLYWGISIFGFLISLYLAFYVQNVPLIFIYPSAIYLLYIYSKSLKKSVLWGNLIVSIFCAFVAGIVIFAERQNVFEMGDAAHEVIIIFLFYLLFAFFSTMFREIIKDIEDEAGDRQNGCQTLPIIYGKTKAKNTAIFFGVILLGILVYWGFYDQELVMDKDFIYLNFGIIFPLLFSIFKLYQAKSKKDFHLLSQFSKYIILSGILYLLILNF